MDKRFLGILGVLIILFVGIFAISQNSSDNSTGSNNNSSQATNHLDGKGSKGITLTEYGDYQCPVCAVYYQPLKDAVAKYSNDIYFQFRNLPLSPSPHPNAFAAARAAEAAGLQNKYWQMHGMIYEKQTEWQSAPNPQTFFNNYAQQISLNLDQFKKDYASSKVNSAINADLAAFDNTGQEKSTPSFFVNGRYVPNSQLVDASGRPTADSIGKFIQNEIAKKTSSTNQ